MYEEETRRSKVISLEVRRSTSSVFNGCSIILNMTKIVGLQESGGRRQVEMVMVRSGSVVAKN